MAASTKPSEFGGKTMRNGVQPSPHVPTPSERLMLLYTTGDDSGLSDRDNGEVWQGLLPADVQRAAREAAGDLVVGEVWESIQVEAAAAISELAASEGTDAV